MLKQGNTSYTVSPLDSRTKSKKIGLHLFYTVGGHFFLKQVGSISMLLLFKCMFVCAYLCVGGRVHECAGKGAPI